MSATKSLLIKNLKLEISTCPYEFYGIGYNPKKILTWWGLVFIDFSNHSEIKPASSYNYEVLRSSELRLEFMKITTVDGSESNEESRDSFNTE